jgi:PKHD-type hydroxylase
VKNPYPNLHKSKFLDGDTFVQRIPHSFTADELMQLRAIIDENSRTGTTYDSAKGGKVPNDRRRSNVCFLRPADYPWVSKKIGTAIEALNNKYCFDVAILGELQLAYYDEKDQGFYDWHMDIGPGAFFFRKISISLVLNSPDDYDGGDVEFNTGGRIQQGARSNTELIAFPSFLLHRVTPVTRGRRYVLIAWVHGGDWR